MMSIWNRIFGGSNGHTDDSIEMIQRNIAEGLAVMLDVRGQQERDAGYLLDSIFIPITDVTNLEPDVSMLPGLAVDKIVYCH